MSDQPAVVVKDLYKTFKLPHEQHSGIKQVLINILKRKRGYELQHVLDDISFEIEKGDFFAIVGRNGSGKSTLLKLLAGIYAPDKGLVQVNGSLTPFIELGVGFNPELTGRENVYMNGALLGFSRKEVDSMYEDIVTFAELERFMDQKLKNYSSGMQVRLAFSIAIRAKSDILLLDEVLAVGDAAFQQKCFDYFEELRAQKKTVIFVSHDMVAVRRFCTKAVYIKEGKLTHIGTATEIADVYTLENIDNDDTPEPVDGIGLDLPDAYSVGIKIEKQTDNEVRLIISYKAKENEKLYAAMSIIKDGLSVAELSTPEDLPLMGKGEVTYILNTDIFNGGIYQIPIALCRWKNRELVAVGKKRAKFAVKSSDITRGGVVKLQHNWHIS